MPHRMSISRGVSLTVLIGASAVLFEAPWVRRTMKRAIETTMDSGAKGIKIQLAGRLGGSEMARCEKATAGSLPLSTLRAKIDYGFAEAWTAQGNIGVQIWINQGMYEGDATDGADAQASEAPKKPKRTYKR